MKHFNHIFFIIIFSTTLIWATTDTFTLYMRNLVYSNYVSTGNNNGEIGGYSRGATSGYSKELLFHVDLSTLAGVTINSVTFRFNISEINTGGVLKTVYLYEQDKGTYDSNAEYLTYTDAAWTNSVGNYTDDSMTGFKIISTTELRNLVSDWINSVKTNNGLILAGNFENSSYEWTITGAELEIDYTSPTSTWDGGGTDNNWSTPTNWSEDVIPESTSVVIFDNTSTKNCVMDISTAIKSITFTAGYTGTFDLNSNNLTISHDADFSSGGSIFGSSSTIFFTGSGSRTIVPSLGTLPTIVHMGSSETSIMSNNLICDSLEITDGTLNLNSFDLTVTYSISVANTGTLDGSTGRISVANSVYITSSSAVLDAPSDSMFIGKSFSNSAGGTFNSDSNGLVIFNSTYTGNYIYSGGVHFSNVVFNGAAGEWTLQDDFSTDTLLVKEGNLICGTDKNHEIGYFLSEGFGGEINFSSCTLNISMDADFSELYSFSGTNGWIKFDGPGTQNFTPKSTYTFSRIVQTGTGTTVVRGIDLYTDTLIVKAGNFNADTCDIFINHDLILDSTGTFNGSSGKIKVYRNLDIASSTTTLIATSDTLFIGGNFYNDGSGTITSTNGIVLFNSASSGNLIYPGINSFNHIVFNGTGGEWTFQTSLTADTVSFFSGTVYFGTGLNHEINTVQSDSFSTTNLYFNNSSLIASKNVNFAGLTNLFKGSGNITFNGISSQLFYPSTDTLPDIIVNSTSEVVVSEYDVKTTSFRLTNGTFDLSTNSRGLAVRDSIVVNNGTLNALNGNVASGGDVTINSNGTISAPVITNNFIICGSFNNYGTFNHNYGQAEFFGQIGTHSINIGSSSFYNLQIWGPVSTWSFTANTSAENVQLIGGTLDFGTGLSHAFKSFYTLNDTTTGILIWNTASVQIDSIAYFDSLSALNNPDGTLEFVGASPVIQILKPGSSLELPEISHTGNSTLRISGNDLLCRGFSQNNGTLDFNGNNITTDSSGNFSLSNGTSSSILNLAGITISVDGNFSASGQSGNLLNLTPGSTWYLQVNGSCNVEYASVGYSDATGYTMGTPTENCVDSSNNINWAFNYAPTNITLSPQNIDENEVSGTTVGSFITTDTNSWDSHTYTLVSGTGDTDNESFTISGDSLTTSEVFDFETKSGYSIRVRTTDNGIGAQSYEKQFTITVININEPPDINGTVSTLTYTENETARTIDSTIIISDVDNAYLDSAIIIFSSNYIAEQDTLIFSDQNGITGVFNDATGVLELTGSASLTDYQTALRSISYYNSENSPSVDERVLDFSVYDGFLTSNSFTPTITINAVNDLPVISMNTDTISYTENDSIFINDSISITDLDNDSLSSATIRIIANYVDSEDTLIFVNQSGISGIYDSVNGILTLSGTATHANYIFGLQSVKYVNKSVNPTQVTRTIRVIVNDGTDSSVSVTRNITVTSVNEAPAANNDSYSTDKNTMLYVSPMSGVLSNDFDLESDSLTATLDPSVVAGTLNFNSDGSFSYLPQTDYSGSVSFTYKAYDGIIMSNSATVTISIYDTAKPVLISLSPADNATNVGVNDNLILKFDEIITIDTGNITIYHSADNTVFESIDVKSTVVTGNGTDSVIINPNADFRSETSYHVYIDSTCFADASGNYYPGISANANTSSSWIFSVPDIITQPPVFSLPNSSTLLDSIFMVDFTLPETALNGSVQLVFTQTIGNTDTNSPHVITFNNGFESAQNHTTTIEGMNLSNNTNILSVSSEPNDFLVQGAVYDVTIQYTDSSGNIPVSIVNNNVVYNNIIKFNTAIYNAITDSLLLVFDQQLSSQFVADTNKLALFINNNTIDSFPIQTPWNWSFGTTSDSIYIHIGPDISTIIENLNFDVNNLFLYSEEYTFGTGTMFTPLISYDSGLPLAYIKLELMNSINVNLVNIGDSSITLSINLTDSSFNNQTGIHINVHTKDSLPDTLLSFTSGFHDTTFNILNTVKQGWWYCSWAPFDSLENTGEIRLDSIYINNSPPEISLPFISDTVFEDSLWVLTGYARDINDDSLMVSVISPTVPLSLSQSDFSISCKPLNRDVGDHNIMIIIRDNGGLSDSASFILSVLNTNDIPELYAIAFPDTIYEDSLTKGSILLYEQDKDDSLEVTISSQVPWLQSQVLRPINNDTLWKIDLYGVPLDRHTGYHEFSVTVNDRSNKSVTANIPIFIVNTNDAPETYLTKKVNLYGAVQYVVSSVDDFDSTITYFASLHKISAVRDSADSGITSSNNNGIFNYYPLTDGTYYFSCHAMDKEGLKDLTPIRDTLIITGASSHSWDDTLNWNMVSIPAISYSADSFKTSGSILHWDESKTAEGIYKYYTRSNDITNLTHSKAYWIKINSGKVNVTLSNDNFSRDSITIQLVKAEYGWNQISSPFPYPVKWPSDLTLWKWDNSMRDFVEYDSVLYPWEGYWVHTENPQSVTIYPEPYLVTHTRSKCSKIRFVDKSEWIFSVELISNINRDTDNLFGISKHAKDEFDNLDRPEPPRMRNEPYITFPHPEWNRSVTEYASDIRHSWNKKTNIFQTGISPCNKDITSLTLNITGKEDDMPVYLFIHSENKIIEYKKGLEIPVQPTNKKQYRTIFASQNKYFLKNFPHRFAFNHPYPNPVRSRAVIHYTLPYRWEANGWLNTDPYNVKLLIYDARGRIVQELINRKQIPGHYKIMWKGMSKTGHGVASGAYILRLEAEKYVSVKRILFIR